MVDIFDRLAIWGRKYQQQTAPGSHSTRFTLHDVLSALDRQAILELKVAANGKTVSTAVPDPVRKTKVSLLDDGIAPLHSASDDWFEVYRTPPSGDLSKVKIVAHGADGRTLGEVEMLVGRRSYEQYFREDPLLDTLRKTK